MTGTDIITDVRVNYLKDTATLEADRRWSEAEYLDALNGGLQDLWRLQPEEFWKATVVVVAPSVVTDITLELTDVQNSARLPLVHFMAAELFLKDAEDTHNRNAALIHREAYRSMTSPAP